MTRGQRHGGNMHASLSHACIERGTPMQSLKLFLWDVAAVLGALLLVSATGVGIAFALFILFFGYV